VPKAPSAVTVGEREARVQRMLEKVGLLDVWPVLVFHDDGPFIYYIRTFFFSVSQKNRETE